MPRDQQLRRRYRAVRGWPRGRVLASLTIACLVAALLLVLDLADARKVIGDAWTDALASRRLVIASALVVLATSCAIGWAMPYLRIAFRSQGARIGALLALILTAGLVSGIWVFSSTPPDKVSDSGPSRAMQAVQAAALLAALAGGAVTVWLNDRRRQNEEGRRLIEQGRLDQDRSRGEEEQFARAVELLGHEAAAVRTGAMHALAGIARVNVDRRQTILDIFCAYLRQPSQFTPTAPAEVRQAAQEREVRLTAARLTADLLPLRGEDTSAYLDLTGAAVERLSISGRRFSLQASRAIFKRLEIMECTIEGIEALGATFEDWTRLSDSRVLSMAEISNCTWSGFCSLSNLTFDGDAEFNNSSFLQGPYLNGCTFHGYAAFTNCKFHRRMDFTRAADLGPHFSVNKSTFESVKFPITPSSFTAKEAKVAQPQKSQLPQGWQVLNGEIVQTP